MLIFGFIKHIWENVFNELRIMGKIVFFLFFVLATICFMLLGIVELVVIDIWVILFEYFKKDSDVKGMIELLINW
jgi:hypothetical protein